MVWDYLGKLELGPEWQQLDISSLDDSLLRIRHSYTDKPFGYALLSSIFSDGSRGLFRRLYPYDDEAKLLLYEVDPEFRAAGFETRFLSIKTSLRARITNLSWFIEIEIWSDDVIADGGGFDDPDNGQTLDGGTYP